MIDFKWINYKIINAYTEKKAIIKKVILRKESYIKDIKKYAGRNVLNAIEANDYIKELIKKKESFMICRFGQTEMNMIIAQLQTNHFPYTDRRKKSINKLCRNAGFFPNELEKAEKFVELMLKECAQIDLCGMWNLYMEDYILERYAPAARLTNLGSLEPWNEDVWMKRKPWTSELKGKKVLVIHPFDETIMYQYKNHRTNIFERKYEADDILPEFELITLKAVQTINYNSTDIMFDDWFEALNYMIGQCQKIDFDIAIIGCGAYGFPLAAAIKKMGKGAIHLGGATQILFGIIGKRWENGEYKIMLDEIRNEYWTRPLPSEKPKNSDEIEGGCYW